MGKLVGGVWVDWMNVKVLQKAVVIDEKGNMLALRRSENAPGARPGMWDLPGGSMDVDDLEGNEDSEPHADAIKREVVEETGLGVLRVEEVCVSSGVKQMETIGKVLILALGYRCYVDGVRPAINLGDEHCESRWISKEEFLKLDFGDDGGLHKKVIRKA